MIKIGVISDTHLQRPDKRIIEIAKTYFKDVSFVIHAGDLVELEILSAFHPKEVKAVCGNMDSPHVRKKLPESIVISVGKFKIGVTHGSGSPYGIEERVLRKFSKVDCIIYGHTHTPKYEKIGEVIFLNPGSANNFYGPDSLAILKVGDEISAEIIYI